MARIPEYPPAPTGNLARDYENLRQYLIRQIQEQNRAEIEAERGGGGGGETVTVDEQLDPNSANPVRNAAIVAGLNGKAENNHVHDSRYYTEAEMDALLTGKADADHNHDSRYYTESEVNTLLSGKSNTDHTHDSRYYTESEVDTLLAGKAGTDHTHDNRYYTETEVDTKLAGKISEPASDGTSGQVLATDGNGGRYWKNDDSGGGVGSVGIVVQEESFSIPAVTAGGSSSCSHNVQGVTGYTAVGIVGINMVNTSLSLSRFNINSTHTQAVLRIKNTSATSDTPAVYGNIYILYAKD